MVAVSLCGRVGCILIYYGVVVGESVGYLAGWSIFLQIGKPLLLRPKTACGLAIVSPLMRRTIVVLGRLLRSPLSLSHTSFELVVELIDDTNLIQLFCFAVFVVCRNLASGFLYAIHSSVSPL